MSMIKYIVKDLAYILITVTYGYYTYREGYKQAKKDLLEYIAKSVRRADTNCTE